MFGSVAELNGGPAVTLIITAVAASSELHVRVRRKEFTHVDLHSSPIHRPREDRSGIDVEPRRVA